jgi:phosphoenolpyruvate-protein kinase (PTS system EI component)
MTVCTAQKAGIPVSVCGEMAGDPALSQILAVMGGITELSMYHGSIGGVKKSITGISKKEAEEKAMRCLACAGLDQVMDILTC